MHTLNKILVSIQGRSLILNYLVRRAPADFPAYIEVLISDELSQFNLKGLTPEMFCVNLADMVNIQGKFSGQIVNEKQLPVAKWKIDHEEYLKALQSPANNLSISQLSSRLTGIAGFIKQQSNQYFDFEEIIEPENKQDAYYFSGYRLTIVIEETEQNRLEAYAYYYLDTHTATGWLEKPPPLSDQQKLIDAVTKKITEIENSGLKICSVRDETFY